MSWKLAVKDSGEGYYTLHTQEIGAVPVRLFLTPNLLDQVEDSIYPQIINAADFPGVKLVAITPDVHHGYGVPIGTVLLTDADTGAVAMGPTGYDIGCGMMSASSEVEGSAATTEHRLRTNAVRPTARRQPRLRPWAGDELFPAGQRREPGHQGARSWLFHAGVGALSRLSERGRSRRELRHREPARHVRTDRHRLS